MRLVTFVKKDAGSNSAPHLGAFFYENQQIIDFFEVLKIPENDFNHKSALLEWFNLDGVWLPQAEIIYKRAKKNANEFKASIIDAKNVKFLAPVPCPGKIICIGLNYRDHAVESNMPIPERPIVFSKFTTSIIGPDENIIIPPLSEKTDYEAELAVVLGKRAKNVSKEDAFNYVLGYTNFNDISERGFQFADGQWQRGKSCDTFAPMGTFIATKDEVPDPHSLSIKFRLNGKTLQKSNTAQLIFDIPHLISFLSETITLEPGDVIATGTPPGVGFGRKPPIFLKDGDVVEVEIEKLGVLLNKVCASPYSVSQRLFGI
jgi:2-keto-4-pentenoate hydratase/2-oxohepta-3-ene-1,7-dioic acid hydratase in catechol pathway